MLYRALTIIENLVCSVEKQYYKQLIYYFDLSFIPFKNDLEIPKTKLCTKIEL